MPFIEQDGAKIYYEIHGEEGPWVTLVNGHTRTSHDFKMFTRNLLKQGFRTILFDNRGAGKTEITREFSLDEIMSDIASIWQNEQVESTHVLGISMGGWICQGLAVKYPQVIDSLVLVSTCQDKGPTSQNQDSWGETLEAIQSKLSLYFSEDFVAKNSFLVQSMSKQILKQNQGNSFEESAKMQRNAMAIFELENLAEQIKTKTLVIHGGEDRIIPSNQAMKLHDLINESKLEIIEEVGHLLLAECPNKLYQITIDFFKSANAS